MVLSFPFNNMGRLQGKDFKTKPTKQDSSSAFRHPTTCSFKIWQTSWSLNHMHARTGFLLCPSSWEFVPWNFHFSLVFPDTLYWQTLCIFSLSQNSMPGWRPYFQSFALGPLMTNPPGNKSILLVPLPLNVSPLSRNLTPQVLAYSVAPWYF